MATKYLIAALLSLEAEAAICHVMNRAARIFVRESLAAKLPPHITLHPPLTAIDEAMLISTSGELVAGLAAVQLATAPLTMLGNEFLVVPLTAVPLKLSRFWVSLHDRFRAADHEQGIYEENNTLHITIAEKLSRVPEEQRALAKRLRFQPMMFSLTALAVYRKPESGKPWEEIKRFSLS